MTRFNLIFFICTAFVTGISGNAQQNTFSIGVKGGFGVPVPDPGASIDAGTQSYMLRTHASYSGGILAQYVLGDAVGIETGVLNTYGSYSRKDLTNSYLLQSLGWDANIGINSYQIPVQFMYLFRPGMNPNMRIKLTGGIAMDWLTMGFLKRQENPLLVSSFLLGARIKTRAGKYGRMEYGLEYQYTLNGAYAFSVQTAAGMQTVHSRFATLSFNLYYFFFNRERNGSYTE